MSIGRYEDVAFAGMQYDNSFLPEVGHQAGSQADSQAGRAVRLAIGAYFHRARFLRSRRSLNIDRVSPRHCRNTAFGVTFQLSSLYRTSFGYWNIS